MKVLSSKEQKNVNKIVDRVQYDVVIIRDMVRLISLELDSKTKKKCQTYIDGIDIITDHDIKDLKHINEII